MPYKSSQIKIEGTQYDKRIKLFPEDKEEIKKLHSEGASIRSLAKSFKVSRRLIQFIIFPERHQKNIEDRKARGGSKYYYKTETHTEYMKTHRSHKQKLYLEGKIK